MGQYYIVVNRDKRQYLHAHAFIEGLKYGEFTHSSEGTMTALAFLLSSTSDDERPTNNPMFGAWAGDRIVIAGDYDDTDKFTPPQEDIDAYLAASVDSKVAHANLHNVARRVYEDISPAVLVAMQDV